MASTNPSVPLGPKTPVGVRYASRGVPSPTGRSAEAARDRTLRRDKDNFSALRDRSKKHVVNGPYKLRPPVRISTKTIDTDTIGRLNKANQRMSQFLYNLANEPSVGLYHVNDHVKRTVPRLVATRKDMDFHKVEMDKSSCDVEEILPTVRTIGSLTAFKSMQTLLQKSIQLATPRPASSSSSTSSKTLVPPSPNRSPASTSPNSSMRQIDTSLLSTPKAGSSSPQLQASPQHASIGTPEASPEDDSIVAIQEQISSSPATSESTSTTSHVVPNTESDLPSTYSSIIQEENLSPTEESKVGPNTDANRPVLDPFGGQTEDVIEVDLSTSATTLTQEEAILGNRPPSSKRKKRQDRQEDDSLVPKAF